MYKLLKFLKKIYVFFIFLVLEIAAFSIYTKSSIYTNARITTELNRVFVGLQGNIQDVKSFFFLKQENEKLSIELSELKNELALLKRGTLSSWVIVSDTLTSLSNKSDSVKALYSYMPARVVNNSYIKQNNYITINKGSADGVVKDMSIVVGNNIVGYILNCSENYSVGISMLNTQFKTSGRSSNGNYNGSIRWNGADIQTVYMSEIPKYAEIQVGDTIQTTSFSSKFPDGINIGVVKNIEFINGTYHTAEIDIFTDFSILNNVNLINFEDYKEKIELEQSAESTL